MHRRCICVGLGVDLYAVGYHKRRVEAQAKVPDNTVCRSFTLIFADKVECTRKCDVTNVLIQLLLAHADTVIRDADGACILIKLNRDAIGVVHRGDLTQRLQTLEFGHGVGRVGNDLAQKNILFGIEPFFDNGEYAIYLKTEVIDKANRKILNLL